MRPSIKILILLIGLFIHFEFYAQQNSILSSGQWAKVEVTEQGVYKISKSLFDQMGFDGDNVDPRMVAIYGTPPGMLPQRNDANWPTNLQQIPIQIIGENDGQFDDGDIILFYGTGAHKTYYDNENGLYIYEKNLYAEQSYYFITVQSQAGLRMGELNDLGDGFTTLDYHDQVISHEIETFNLLKSGREWFGERITNELALNFDNSDAKEGIAKIQIAAIAQSFNNSQLSVSVNGEGVGSLDFSPIPNQQYSIKANPQFKSLEFQAQNSVSVRLQYDRNGSNTAVSYLDHLLLNIPTFNSYSQPFRLSNESSIESSISQFDISSNREIFVWNITEPLVPNQQQLRVDDQRYSFSNFSDELQFYWVFNTDDIQEPAAFEQLDNQNLEGATVPEFIIITHTDFMEVAQKMANRRSSVDGISTLAVNIDEIYNEYSGGRQDVSAIRNFIKQKYDQSTSLQFVLFLGKGSYDYKDRIDGNTNYVPTYESRNSIHPLFTYSSDDYFGFLEDHEGEWLENRAGDHTLEIGIGRIPVTSAEEAEVFFQKWLTYQSSLEGFGNWRGKVAFVADDGDRNIHQRDADILARTVDQQHKQFELSKLYLDAFPQENLPSGQSSEEAEKALLDAVNDGTLLINFTGHGAESGWMQERILTFDLMEEWNNPYTLPFLVTATCEFGRNDDPLTVSGAEFLINKENSGAIGLVTTARPVFSSTNFSLNQALYDVILSDENGLYNRLGDIIRYTKNNSLEGSLNRNFILLGDPSLRLAYPQEKIVVQGINDQNFTNQDTIRALDRVSFQGEILDNSNRLDPLFNGTLEYELIDKATEKTTFGTESDAFNYWEKDRVLARGSVNVSDGLFEIETQVPQNIDYSYGNARLQFYAIDSARVIDAVGAFEDFVLGGTSESSLNDNSPPEGQLFLNDLNSELLSSYSSSVLFIARLADENGINISDNGLGQNIEMTLNDSTHFILNEYFSNLPNQLEQGELRFGLDNLPNGQNSIHLKFWDNFGNPNSLDLTFEVSENSSIINEIKNYPNPLETETYFAISHKLAGEDLNVHIEILSSNGQQITSIDQEIFKAPSDLIINWNALNNYGVQLEKGMYIYNIQLTSKTSGLSDSKSKKLLISY